LAQLRQNRVFKAQKKNLLCKITRANKKPIVSAFECAVSRDNAAVEAPPFKRTIWHKERNSITFRLVLIERLVVAVRSVTKKNIHI
jgi:hypothetical protein